MFSDGIVFSSFDFLQGPIVVYTTIDDSIAKKISLKVLYATLTGHNSQIDNHEKNITSSSVVPMQEDDLIVFVYVFPLVDPNLGPDNVRVSSICFVSDIENKRVIYQSAPKLEEYSKNLVEYLKENFQWDEPINDRTIKKFTDLTSIPNEYLRDSLSKKIAVSTISKRERKELKRLKLLKPFNSKGLDKIIFGIFSLQKLLIIHPNYSIYIDDILDVVDFFNFYRHMEVEECIADNSFNLESNAPDIQIGIGECLKSENIDNINSSLFIILNLESETVIGGKSNSFFYSYFQGKTHMFTDHLFYSFVESDFKSLTRKWQKDVELLKPLLEVIYLQPDKKFKAELKNLLKNFDNIKNEGEKTIIFQFFALKYPDLTKKFLAKKIEDVTSLHSKLITPFI